jgi:hypothetical protein
MKGSTAMDKIYEAQKAQQLDRFRAIDANTKQQRKAATPPARVQTAAQVARTSAWRNNSEARANQTYTRRSNEAKAKGHMHADVNAPREFRTTTV